MRNLRIYSLNNFQTYHISVLLQSLCHTLHYIPSTYLSCNWKFAPFDYLYPVFPPPTLVTTNLISFSVSLGFLFIFRFHYLFFSWKRKWQPTPVFLPGKSHGERSLVGYSPQGCKKLDTTEQLSMHAYMHTLQLNVTKEPNLKFSQVTLKTTTGITAFYYHGFQ